MSQWKRIGFIGASYRAMHGYMEPLSHDYADTHELVGAFDTRPARVDAVNAHIGTNVPAFETLDDLLDKGRPDVVVVASVDATHADYIETLLDRGVDCVSEKPLCISAEQCRQIRAAQARHPERRAITAHNYRYNPANRAIAQVLASGRIGAIRTISYEVLLGREHGSSYFRRWNRQRGQSGGLLVHKSCHQFDLMNWFVQSRPREMVAHGGLVAYGPGASPFHGEHCHTCPHAQACDFHIDFRHSGVRAGLYAQSHTEGAYVPDLCVFSPEIDSPDHATVAYAYENGVLASYRLAAHRGPEEARLVVEGSEATLEFGRVYQRALDGAMIDATTQVVVVEQGKPPEAISVDKVAGGHGGADTLMLRDLFGAEEPSPAMPTLEDGIQAVLLGAGAMRSMDQGSSPVDVQALAPR